MRIQQAINNHFEVRLQEDIYNVGEKASISNANIFALSKEHNGYQISTNINEFDGKELIYTNVSLSHEKKEIDLVSLFQDYDGDEDYGDYHYILEIGSPGLSTSIKDLSLEDLKALKMLLDEKLRG